MILLENLLTGTSCNHMQSAKSKKYKSHAHDTTGTMTGIQSQTPLISVKLCAHLILGVFGNAKHLEAGAAVAP